jgi:hypothetical protein
MDVREHSEHRDSGVLYLALSWGIFQVSYASRAGRAHTSIRNLHAQAVCDRCGIWYSINELKWQVDWRGTALANLRILVCPPCYDVEQQAVMPLALTNGAPTQYGRVLPVLSVTAVGCLVTVTCSAVHGLSANDQVSVLGLTSANGFYSVQVPTATVFTLQTASPQNPALTPGVRIVTAQVGLPLGFTDFPV